MAKNKEYESYAEIGAYLHRDEGEARVETYTSVNSPLKVSASKAVEQISKVRVTMHVEEDKGVTRDGFYMKGVRMSQTRDNNTEETKSNGSSKQDYPYSQRQEDGQKDLPAWGKVLKNLVDEVSANTRLSILLAVVGIVLAAGAFVMAVL